MLRLDQACLRLQRRVRSHALLYRLTIGTRVLLAVGFIPTGLVKLLGLRFTVMSVETEIGGFFETMYQSGPYWQFLGLTQVLAGLLVLWPATATLGALLFFGIMTNIFVITLSYDFNFTPVVTGMMLLATVYLLAWDYDRLRGLVGSRTLALAMPEHRLSGAAERLVYATGVIAGTTLMIGQRGLLPPGSWHLWPLLVCFVSLFVAVGYGLMHRRTVSSGTRLRA
jgi:uncharacterized membrane protein YphA (DoxX/SURF4 family)